MARQPLEIIEARVLVLSAEQFGIEQECISLDTRPVEDLGIDSLDLIEWMMAMEETFDVSLPDPTEIGDPVYKEAFTRPELNLRDMAELIHLRWGSGHVAQSTLSKDSHQSNDTVAFSQLGGVLTSQSSELYRPLGKSDIGIDQFRRTTDGMVCLKLPSGSVEVGSKCSDAFPDERPLHTVDMPSFLIDRETISTTAYCRFLNSIGEVDDEVLCTWFLIEPGQRRFEHQLIEFTKAGWAPKTGTEEWPMILVTWFGAVAYSLWANDEDWRNGRSEYLPKEQQWEYAARGPISIRWPWGARDPKTGEINAGRHKRHAMYKDVTDLPLSPVNALTGVSPFGVLQMAGNVWQWCSNWYDPLSYAEKSDVNQSPISAVRSERGGSWVSPTNLSRSSYRRGRVPHARGRCLGFRCVGNAPN
ncbi:MAG: SUMF1/EgtB/PvdO family nonheme iron enzyme [Stappiaceae bacterium]